MQGERPTAEQDPISFYRRISQINAIVTYNWSMIDDYQSMVNECNSDWRRILV